MDSLAAQPVHGAALLATTAVWITGAVVYTIWFLAKEWRRYAFGRIRPRGMHLGEDLWPFALPAIIVMHIALGVRYGDPLNPWRIAFLAMQVWSWWNDRNNNDRWRRRRRKAADRIAEQAGKLVVTPEPDASV